MKEEIVVKKGPPINSGIKNRNRLAQMSMSIILLFSMIAMAAAADTVPPITNVSGVIEKGIYNRTATITLEASDEIDGSGVNYTEYRSCYNDENFSLVTNCSNLTTYTGPFNVVLEGFRAVKFRSVDNASNKENWKYINFTIDKTDPNLTIPENITVEATDVSIQIDIGLATVEDNMDKSPIITNDAPDLFPIGTTKVTWIAKDWANNTNKSYQYVNILRQAHPMLLNFSVVPNTSINESNPATISGDIIKGINKTRKVLIGVMDDNNLTDRAGVLYAYMNTSGIDGNYEATWQGKLSEFTGESSQFTEIHLDGCSTCPENNYLFGIYKKTDTSNESRVYVWINDTGKITSITYGNYSLSYPKDVNIPIGGNSSIRYMKLEWNGVDFEENFSDIPIPIYNVTGPNADSNPVVVENNVSEGRYKAFIRAEDTQGNYSILDADIDTIVPTGSILPTPIPTANATPTPNATSIPNGGSSNSGSSSSSGGSSGSSGGGGGGIGTSEPYSNILKYEVVDNDITTSPVIYRYATLNTIYEVVVTGTQSNEATLRVELLKDVSKLVNISPPEKNYKNFNMWINSKRINNISIRYKVENSWLVNNNLNKSDIKLYGWKGGQWIYLDTRVLKEDGVYTYMESDSGGLSIFGISGEKSLVPNNDESIVDTVDTNYSENTTIALEKEQGQTTAPLKSPGFEMILAVLVILTLHMRNKR